MATQPIEWLPATPPNKHNTVPTYAVVWDTPRPGKPHSRSGNAWPSKAKAEAVYRERLVAGRNPSASIEWVAGHL